MIQGLRLRLCGHGTYLAQIRIYCIRLWETQVMDSDILEHMNHFILDGYDNNDFKLIDERLYGFCN